MYSTLLACILFCLCFAVIVVVFIYLLIILIVSSCAFGYYLNNVVT